MSLYNKCLLCKVVLVLLISLEEMVVITQIICFLFGVKFKLCFQITKGCNICISSHSDLRLLQTGRWW
jgi:hypothetical protein